MRRRTVVLGMGALAASFGVRAQQGAKMPRVGYLFSFAAPQGEHLWEACRTGLRELGYVLVSAATPASLAAGAGSTPIVIVAVGDPLAIGLVSSLSTVPATLAGYDHASGFGLLKLAAPLAGKPMPLGDAAALEERDQAIVANATANPSLVQVVSRRLFTGNWEYLLDAAIFTSPPVMDWSGAALIGPRGELLGIGSLIVPDAGSPGTQSPGNMFVPVDLLKPILDDLVAKGRRSGAARPWLGINAEYFMGRLFVARGGAGTQVPLKVLQGMQIRDVTVRSIDRVEYLKPAKTY